MSYLESGRAHESIVRQRAYQAPQIGITESLQTPGLATPPPVSNTAALAQDFLQTISMTGHLAGTINQINREAAYEAERARRQQEAEFSERMRMQDAADKANESQILGTATRAANTLQASLVNDIKTGRVALDDQRTPQEIASDIIRSNIPENAGGVYATRMYDELIRPLTEAVVSARTAFQENERKVASADLSNAVFGAKNMDEVRAAMSEAQSKGVDPQAVLTNGVQALASLGDSRAIEYAASIVDPEARAAVIVSARKQAEEDESNRRLAKLNELSLRVQNAGHDIGTLNALRNEIQAYQAEHPESRDTLQAFGNSIQSTIRSVADNAIQASVKQKELEFKQNAAVAHSAALASAVESGRGYAMLDSAEQTGTITYTKADGTTETKEVKYAATEADAYRAMTDYIDQKAKDAAGGDPVAYRRTRLDLMRQNAMVDKDLSRIASAGIAKLSEYSAQEGATFPPESIEGFNVYLDSRDIAPGALSLNDNDRKLYDLAMQARDTGFVSGDPSSAESKSRALSWAIRAMKNPNAKLSEKTAGEVASAARSATAELFDLNLDEEGRVADAAEAIRNKAAFYLTGGLDPEQSIAAAKRDIVDYGRKVNGHWTMTYTPMPQNLNGKTLDQNLDRAAAVFAEKYGKFNVQDEAWIIPGSSTMTARDVKFVQQPSGRWVVTDDRNPYNTSLTVSERGDRLPELTTSELSKLVDDVIGEKIINDNQMQNAGYSAIFNKGVPMRGGIIMR